MARLNTAFYEATQAGHRYVNARGASLRIIEGVADLGPIGPSTFENLWREKSLGKNPDTKIIVLSGNGELEKLTEIWVYNFKGGFPFLYEVVAVFRRIIHFLRYTGIALVFVGALGSCIGIQRIVPLCL
jgi:hypothetical protein